MRRGLISIGGNMWSYYLSLGLPCSICMEESVFGVAQVGRRLMESPMT